MTVEFTLNAEPRAHLGKRASRRLRRTGQVPAVLYGGGQPPESLYFPHNELLQQLNNEAFYSHILKVNIGDRQEQAILKALQRHPYKPAVLHMDLQRISADAEIRVRVPLHFVHENVARGVKEQGGVISHLMIDVEIACLPRDLPEYIEVDVANLGMGESVHLSDLKLPEGVQIVQLIQGEEYDVPVVSIHHARTAADEEEAEERPEGEAPPSQAPGSASED